ncbi:MAG: FAD-dependent oxidoreductase [Bauldia sp.]
MTATKSASPSTSTTAPSCGRSRSPSPTTRTSAKSGIRPAGLKAAETSARRGHRVILLERNRALGGQLLYAEKQPEHQNVTEVTSYLEIVAAELGVDIRRGLEGTTDAIHALAPDIVIVATGSEPNLPRVSNADSAQSLALGRHVLPEVEGLDRDFVVSSDDVLSGRVVCSGRVVVADNNGHWEAAGTAEFVADNGCDVTVVAPHAVGSDLEAGSRTLFYRRAAIKGIKLRSGVSLVSVGDRSVIVSPVFSGNDAIGWAKYLLMPGDEETIEDVDWLVAVIGRRSREDLFLKLKADPRFASVRVERIGDCVAPRMIESNIAEAFILARDL